MEFFEAEEIQSKRRTMTVYKLIMLYLLGGLVGTVWETLLNLMRGDGFVFCNGSLFTPFNFVYGTGAVVIIMGLRNRTKIWEVFVIGMVGGGAVEYILSFLEETIVGSRSWDYSNDFLNINGRTTIPYMVFWGILCVAVIFLVYRPLDTLLEAMPQKVMQTVAIILGVIVFIDLVLSLGAILRYAARSAGNEAVTFIGRLYDRLCGDEFMKLRFPQMNFN